RGGGGAEVGRDGGEGKEAGKEGERVERPAEEAGEDGGPPVPTRHSGRYASPVPARAARPRHRRSRVHETRTRSGRVASRRPGRGSGRAGRTVPGGSSGCCSGGRGSPRGSGARWSSDRRGGRRRTCSAPRGAGGRGDRRQPRECPSPPRPRWSSG